MRIALIPHVASLAFLAWTGTAAVHATAAETEPRARIKLRDTVRVTSAEVTLGDVAVLTTSQPQILRELMALPLGPAPRAGEPVRLGRAQLAQWVRARTGAGPHEILWEGPEATRLIRASAEIPGSEWLAVAADGLRAWLAQRSTRAQITPERSPQDIIAPFGRSTLRMRPIPPDAPIARRMAVWVDLWVDDRFVRTVPVHFEVEAHGPAYAANDALPAGARIGPGMLAVREVELSGRAVPPLAVARTPLAGDAALGQLRVPLQPGQVISQRELQPAPDVVRGDWVALRLRAGGVELESRVEALQNGRLGQMVSVKPGNASAPIMARVVGPGQVEVNQ